MFRKSSDEDKVRSIYKKMARMIVSDAAKYRIPLDYSLESIKFVDVILLNLHKEVVAPGKNISQDAQDSYSGFAEMLGCYMLAVVDKNKLAGKLTTTVADDGPSVGFLLPDGTIVDFIGWCRLAIANGEKDKVLPKFTKLNS